MDQVILAQKLESLRRCVQRVQEKTPSNVDQLTQDPDVQDILVLNLTRAVQLCVDVGSRSKRVNQRWLKIRPDPSSC